MPQLKTRTASAVKPKKNTSTGSVRPTPSDAYSLISRMMEYETAARDSGISLGKGRFEMLTASERNFYRAELIADYIRLSVGNTSNTQGYFNAALDSFCEKICAMNIPSHELVGTYLAAVDLGAEDEYLKSVPDLGESIRRTMPVVLKRCCDMLASLTAV